MLPARCRSSLVRPRKLRQILQHLQKSNSQTLHFKLRRPAKEGLSLTYYSYFRGVSNFTIEVYGNSFIMATLDARRPRPRAIVGQSYRDFDESDEVSALLDRFYNMHPDPMEEFAMNGVVATDDLSLVSHDHESRESPQQPSQPNQQQRNVSHSHRRHFDDILCPFCRKNGETQKIYRSHAIRDESGNVTCPVLRRYTCPICKATGGRAHTISHCPSSSSMASQQPTVSSNSLMEYTMHNNNAKSVSDFSFTTQQQQPRVNNFTTAEENDINFRSCPSPTPSSMTSPSTIFIPARWAEWNIYNTSPWPTPNVALLTNQQHQYRQKSV